MFGNLRYKYQVISLNSNKFQQMTAYIRRQLLMEILRAEPEIRVPELATRLSVSEGTIRNDFDHLSADGHIIRVRGGAVVIENLPPGSPAFTTRAIRNSQSKDNIAFTASKLVNDGNSLFLDASTTVYAMARYIQDHKFLRIITNGIEVARLLAGNLSNTVILLGGVLRPDGASITGSLSERFLSDLHIGTAYVSCSGFVPHIGLTEVDIHEAQLKEFAIKSSNQVIALVDSSKFGKADLSPYARTDQINRLITDSQISPDWVDKMKTAGIAFIVSDGSSGRKE